jgi:NitT/TauT family transport system ATP-binding protein
MGTAKLRTGADGGATHIDQSYDPGPGSIIFSHVGVEFKAASVVAVDDVSLTVGVGEFVSVVGPSGCGKTTLLNFAAGLLPADVTRGELLVGGKAPVMGNRDIAYMLARDALCPWRTTLENALLGCEIRSMPARAARARALDLIDKVGLKGFETTYPKALSQGMRQRVALARTFALESPILLMDEPFGALDAQTKLQLEDVLLSLWQRERRTVLFITHDLSEAVLMSDRVIVMSARPGRVIADVPIALPRPRSVRALQKDPTYHELYAEVWTKLEEGLSQ